MDAELRRVIIALLKIFDYNRSRVAKVLHISRNTVAEVAESEKKKDKVFAAEEQKSKEIDTEYQNLLKTVRRLSFRIQGIESRYEEESKQWSNTTNFVKNNIISRLNIIGNEFRSIAENIAKNAKDIEDLQRDVDIFKEIWHDKFIEIKKRSEVQQNERDRVDAKANERAVEVFREAERKREQGSTDVFQQKLEEKKDDKRKMLF